MLADPLPVRPCPHVGEALSAYAVRLAEANGLHWSRVLPLRRDIDIPIAILARIAGLAGLDDAAVRQLTLDRYPPSIRGRGATHRGGWRLHFSVAWVCPACTATTGHTELLWQTALSPVCRTCRVYLVPASRPGPPVPAADPVLRMVDALVDLAEAAITSSAARSRLGRFRRLCASIAQTVDDTRPYRPNGLPAVDRAAARQWGAFPCADPGTVATLLVAAAPTLRSTAEHRRLATEALQRRRGTPAEHPAKYLPQRTPAPPSRTPILPGFTRRDSQRLTWLVAQLARMVRRHHFGADHVPALLPLPTDDGALPDPSQWRTRSHAAIALHMLLAQANGDTPSSASACTAFGTTDTETSALLDGIRLGRGIDDPNAELLLAAAQTLTDAGLVDYQRRRDALRAQTQLPRQLGSGSRLPSVDGCSAGVLALGWIWTRFTRGPMWTSPFPLVPDRVVRIFDQRIDPETRMALHEAGQGLLADTDLVTIPAAVTFHPQITRRYG